MGRVRGLFASILALSFMLSAQCYAISTTRSKNYISTPIDFKKPKHDAGKIDTTIYTAVEHGPEYPGGIGELSMFILKNLKWPAGVKTDELPGKIIVTFVVEKDGALSNIRAIRGNNQVIINEVIRVVKLTGKWKPGMLNRKPVRTQFTIPIACIMPQGED